MSLVFLSHSSENNAQALALEQWLKDNGWAEYFLDISDTRGLVPGTRWQTALKNASHRCQAVVVLVSRAWLASNWCGAEFLLAKHLGKKIFGVLIDDIAIDELPGELTNEWQLCNLIKGDARVAFDVVRKPFVPPTRVALPEVGLDELKRGLQKAGLEATTFPWPPEDEPKRAPYRGLKPFEAKDAAIFFGRDAAIVRGLDQVRQLRDNGIDKLLVILGSSGSGKSSFMRAGLWPRLKRDDHHFYPLPVVRPGGAAMNGEEGLVSSLATAFADVGVTATSRGEMRARFKADDSGETLLGYLQHLRDALVARAVAGTPEPTFILPIDQGEELYASDGAEEAARLRAQLACLSKPGDDSLGKNEGPKLLAMVTIRTDLYGHLQGDALLREVGRHIIDLTPMDRAEYKLIIEGPAERATEAGNALNIEPALTAELLTDTYGADALPMLAFTLERLYTDYRADGKLTLADYRHLGGVTGSLEAAIEAAMDSPRNEPVIPADKDAQMRLLKLAFIPWLAEVDEQSGERRRRVAEWDELPAETHPMLERLTHARLLVRDLRSDGQGKEKREVVEVAHEALLRRWPALVGWLDADQDALKAIGAASRAAKNWTDNQRVDDFLDHRGERLVDAEKLLDREDFKKRLQATGRDYLARCRAVEDERAAKEEKQRRELREAFEEAKKERDQGRRTLSLMHAGLSRQQTDEGHATRGILLALAALPKSMDSPERPYVPQAEAALYGALDALRERRILKGHDDRLVSAAFSPDGARVVTASEDRTARLWDATSGQVLAVLKGHDGYLNSAAVSPDGTRVVTASGDSTARLWDATSGQVLAVLNGHKDSVRSATFSPDGARVVTASLDSTARLWDATSGQELAVLNGHEHTVYSAAFSPDGTRVVTASGDSTARLWEATSGQALAVIKGHTLEVNSAAFSPDGTRVVTASSDNTARLWDVVSGEELAVLKGHKHGLRVGSGVNSAAFSPDGTRVVTASSDNTARLWDAESGEELAVLKGHEREVSSAAFSPDGTRVVTASLDSVRLWAASGQVLAVLNGHEDSVHSAAFSPDGTRVVTASADNTARLWDAANSTALAAVLNGHEGDVNSAAFSPDGTRVVTASGDNTARLWDAESGKGVAVLEGHEGAVVMAAFSPDGTRVVTASGDNTARLWDATSGGELAVLKGHDDWLASAAFSPDGARVVTASGDSTARLWDATSGQVLAVLNGHEDWLNSATFSPDGTRVVTASGDDTARLWDAASGQVLAVLKGHEDEVNSAAFSPDGTRVVTASDDETARLWGAASGQVAAVLKGHEREVNSAAFSPDGTRVVTASLDSVRLWAASGQELAVLNGHEGGVNSAAFSPDGTRVVTASDDNTTRLWDAASGQTFAVIKGHGGEVNSATFSPDGTRVVTASKDEFAALWDVEMSTLNTQALIDVAFERLCRKELTKAEREQFFVPAE